MRIKVIPVLGKAISDPKKFQFTIYKLDKISVSVFIQFLIENMYGSYLYTSFKESLYL